MSGVDLDDIKGTAWHLLCIALDDWYFDDETCRRNTLKEHFHVRVLEGLGL